MSLTMSDDTSSSANTTTHYEFAEYTILVRSIYYTVLYYTILYYAMIYYTNACP